MTASIEITAAAPLYDLVEIAVTLSKHTSSPAAVLTFLTLFIPRSMYCKCLLVSRALHMAVVPGTSMYCEGRTEGWRKNGKWREGMGKGEGGKVVR